MSPDAPQLALQLGETADRFLLDRMDREEARSTCPVREDPVKHSGDELCPRGPIHELLRFVDALPK